MTTLGAQVPQSEEVHGRETLRGAADLHRGGDCARLGGVAASNRTLCAEEQLETVMELLSETRWDESVEQVELDY